MKPCVPKIQTYFDAEQHWHGNRAGFRYLGRGKSDDELREIAHREWARRVETGVIPPKCDRCGFHHKPIEPAA